MPTSIALTSGTPDVNGVAANLVGMFSARAIPGDVRFMFHATDVRCLPGVFPGFCSSPNAAGGPDYSGNGQLNAQVRITDHDNGPSHTEAATLSDIPFPMDMNCMNTSSTSVGGDCTTDTTANALVPGAVSPGERRIWAMDQVKVFDAGFDGDIHMGEGAVTLWLIEGVFVP
jgi:hypothetical protein